MANVALIFRDEMRRMASNVVSVVIALGLVVMPSIFAWYNIIACWNVFDHTGNLTVAVANDDEGYESDLFPLRVNVGEQVVSALRANTQIDWVFTQGEDAVDGARSGRYYAAVVIPQEFSRDMLTFYADDAQHASIIYYSNEKVSAIAPKITDRGADTVSYEVNQVFAKTLSEVALSIAKSVAHYADSQDAGARIAQMAQHISEVALQIDQASSVLRAYGGLADSAATLVDAADDLASSARTRTGALADAAASGAGALVPAAEGLSATLDQIASPLTGEDDAFGAVGDASKQMFDDAQALFAQSSSQMRDAADGLDRRIASYGQIADDLASLEGTIAPEYADVLASAVRMLRFQAETLTQVQANLRSAADKLDAGNEDISAERSEVQRLLSEAHADVSGLSASFDALKPQLESIVGQAQDLARNVTASLETLGSVGDALDAASGDATGALRDAASGIYQTAEDLTHAAAVVQSLADDLSSALASGDGEAISAILTTDVAAFSSALAAPIGVDRIAVYPAENFGSQMAPLYSTLGLFIGSLLILVVLKPAPCRQTRALLTDAKPRQIFLGHFAIMALLSLAQTTLMALGNLFFLQVQVAHPWLYLLVFWLAGLVFTFLIYALVVSFANLGKALAVLLLIIQVTGCGGSFPLQILPPFVQALSPYLPATYVVNAMREAMMGTYGDVFWQQIAGLLAFLIPAALLGLALRKPLERLMQWYLKQVDKSDLMA